MDNLYQFSDRVGLLVSVRDVDEAAAALVGGADVIDVKEPARGSLGAADADTVAAVIAAVGGRAPVSYAAGELFDWSPRQLAAHGDAIGGGAAFCKFGLAGCRSQRDWPRRWRESVAVFPRPTRAVAVVYADWPAADAPPPADVLARAPAAGCCAVLVDTWDKQSGTLLDHWTIATMEDFARQSRAARLPLLLAGSLAGPQLATVVGCRPALVAVRGAACDGDRTGRVSADRVAELRNMLSECNRAMATAAGRR